MHGEKTHLLHQPSIRSSQAACDLVFDYLKESSAENVSISKLFSVIKKAGIQLTDPRLKETMENVARYQHRTLRSEIPNRSTFTLDLQALAEAVHENIVMLHRIIENDFIFPNFTPICNEIDEIYELCRSNGGGEVATYIPQLARFSPDLWGVSLCTIDGQRYNKGDTNIPFCLQSTSKPINYALALTELGPNSVHEFVGFEPSGVSFNTICLNQSNKPHNPLINAGAIVICSLIKKDLTLADRFDYVMDRYRRMAGNEYLSFSNSTFLSERETADRNFALGYYMKEYGCYPPNSDLMETLDFYFQLCSLEVNCESASVMAATLANGGICPMTGERIFSSEAVRDTLSLMHSCGMYDYSGQFAFKCGLPAKSGVSGAILVVIPNVMGLCLWSPPLDKQGNSVRGLQFCAEMVERFHFHNYDSLLHFTSKKSTSCMSLSSIARESPTRRKRIFSHLSLNSDQEEAAMDSDASPGEVSQSRKVSQHIVSILFSAHANDIAALRRAYMCGFDLDACDYDMRTALHIASADGHKEAVSFLLHVCGVNPNAKDRWGFRPLDEASRFGHSEVVELLREAGALSSEERCDKDIEGCEHASDASEP